MGHVLTRQAGYTYLLLLALVALLSTASAVSLQVGESMSYRDRERELLFIGEQFRQALIAYESATPAGMPRWPRELSELVDDRRSGERRSHLRRIYPDPLTGTTTWGVVRDAEGRILAIYSLAAGVPRMKEGFTRQYEAFARADCYKEWVFGIQTLTNATPAIPACGSVGVDRPK